ncbi:MAG: hypothetical protein LKF42_05320 [Streptococcaceae bacterium]|jgi:serine/threonine protein phosphatase PrpC|nr:hypothetical protein [Streptococcaceae bacterium]MCH4176833.1 hypothetical protein [Streptococcaceae bacterium]
MALIASIKSTGEGINQKNQMSYCLKIAETHTGKVMMAVIADGWTEQQRGAIASTYLVERFSHWFETYLPNLSQLGADELIKSQWQDLLRAINQKLLIYGQNDDFPLATTISILLVCESKVAYQMSIGFTPTIKMTGHAYQFLAGEKQQLAITKKAMIASNEQLKDCEFLGLNTTFQMTFNVWTLSEATSFVICSKRFYQQVSKQDLLLLFKPTAIQNTGGINKNLDTSMLLAQKNSAEVGLAIIVILFQ